MEEVNSKAAQGPNPVYLLFCKESFVEHMLIGLCLYYVCGCFELQWQNWSSDKTVWPIKLFYRKSLLTSGHKDYTDNIALQ